MSKSQLSIVVDAQDSDLLAIKIGPSSGYARTTIRPQKYIHCIIAQRMGLSWNRRTEVIDHINRDKLDNRRQNLMKKGLISNESEVGDVEKIMLERGITNHETAAEYHQWMKQAAVPTSSGYNPSAVKQFDLNKYWKNPVSAARNEALNALNDLRKPHRPIGL